MAASSLSLKLIILFVAIICEVISITLTGLYCKDPEDGSLHLLNTTWPARSFCGNYSCKTSKKHNENTKNKRPMKVINVTERNPSKNLLDQTNAGSEFHPVNLEEPYREKNMLQKIIMHKKNPTRNNRIQEDTILKKPTNLRDNMKIYKSLFKSSEDKNDRYLTETEIQIITQMLRTIKKSDLETILEIYSLAKDVFDEIDQESDIDSNIIYKYPIKSNHVIKKIQNVPFSVGSHFYKPNSFIQNKMADLKTAEMNNYLIISPVTEINPTETTSENTATPLSMGTSTYPYFSGIYNTHMHPFKLNPYNSFILQEPNIVPKANYNCTKETPAVNKLIIDPYMRSYVNQYGYLKKLDFSSNYPNRQVNHMETLPGYIYKNNWQNFLPSNAAVSYTQAPLYKEDESNVHHNHVIRKSDEITNDINLEDKEMLWQTPELNEEVLKDVRAYIEKQKRFTLLPLKKVGRLGKVEKAIQIDEIVRNKRDAAYYKINPSRQEVYIETITCLDSPEPGYFQVGDNNLIYPYCCPKKIEPIEKRRP